MPGAFKLDHLQPVKPILFPKFSNFFTFILKANSYYPRKKGKWNSPYMNERQGMASRRIEVLPISCVSKYVCIVPLCIWKPKSRSTPHSRRAFFVGGIYVHESGETDGRTPGPRWRGRGRFCRNLGANLPNYPTHRETATATPTETEHPRDNVRFCPRSLPSY